MSDSVKEIFLDTFQLLTPIQKKIWRHLQWYGKNFRQVFPSHATIAEKVGCCRDTVIQAIKKFSSMGWLGNIKRCFRSSLYFIANELLDLDTTKPETFMRPKEKPKPTHNPTDNPTVKPTPNPTLYNEYTEKRESNERLTSKSGTVQQTSSKEVEHILKSIGIFGKDLFCLVKYSLRTVSKAVEDFKTRKSNEPIRNLAAWLTSRCKTYA